jgi:hypothetical protein
MVIAALFWDGDSTAGSQAYRRLSSVADTAATKGHINAAEGLVMLNVGLWRLKQGDTRGIPRFIELLSKPGHGQEMVCATILDAVHATVVNRSDRDAAIERLDLLMAEGIDWEVEHYAGNLIVAELREAQGDLPKALAAVKRRTFNWYGPHFLSTYLREEGRLATLTGDIDGAIKAYRHFLVLRSDPEPHLVPQRDSIRVELEELLDQRR